MPANRRTTASRRTRGSIDELPSGALRVRVYAGVDPLTRRANYLVETIPAGPSARRQAEAARVRFLAQVDERRNPRTRATVDQLLLRYLEDWEGDEGTLQKYGGYVRKHVSPFIGQLKLGAVDADVLDSLYRELRRCREHCKGSGHVDHRTPRAHVCDERCRPHVCRPLAASTIRHVHFILSGAFKRAVRWRWVATNPVAQATPPPPRPPDPQPPSPADTARILNAAWDDPDWGTFLWLAATTGARRGELCALRWEHLDLERAVLTIRRSITQDENGPREKGTKTHQRRNVALDPQTVAILEEHWMRCGARAAAIGVELTRQAFMFSADPDAGRHLLPSSVSQRYDRLAARLGIATTLHKLRHFSATELITGGVDVRTVAGRLGHGGGGLTTLRVYSAWVSESDQRAASTLFDRMPLRPAEVASRSDRAKTDPRSPYEKIAATLRGRILAGDLATGDRLPPIKQLAAEFGASFGTAQRAVRLLSEWGMVRVATGTATTVLAPPMETTEVEAVRDPFDSQDTSAPPVLELQIRRLGVRTRMLTVEADPSDARTLRSILTAAVRRDGHDPSEIADYDMDVRLKGESEVLTTFAAVSPV